MVKDSGAWHGAVTESQRARHDVMTEPTHVNFSVKLHVEMCIREKDWKKLWLDITDVFHWTV